MCYIPGLAAPKSIRAASNCFRVTSLDYLICHTLVAYPGFPYWRLQGCVALGTPMARTTALAQIEPVMIYTCALERGSKVLGCQLLGRCMALGQPWFAPSIAEAEARGALTVATLQRGLRSGVYQMPFYRAPGQQPDGQELFRGQGRPWRRAPPRIPQPQAPQPQPNQPAPAESDSDTSDIEEGAWGKLCCWPDPP